MLYFKNAIVFWFFFTCQREIQFNKTEDPFSLQDDKTIDKIDNYVAPVIVSKGKLSLYVPWSQCRVYFKKKKPERQRSDMTGRGS